MIMKKEEKQKYQIDPEHEGLSFYQLAEIPKYKGIPVLEMLKLLPEEERNSFEEKQLKNIEMSEKFGFFKFIEKAIKYNIAENLTLKEASESKEYLKKEELIKFEIVHDKILDKLESLNDFQDVDDYIYELNKEILKINPSPIDPDKELLLYHKNRLTTIRDFLENEKSKKVNPKNDKKLTKQTSYKWQTNPDKELPELYCLMKDTFKVIDPQTNLEQFTAVFTGQDIENINPIKWLHTNRLLAYFLDCAFYGQDWQSIAGNGKLFINKNSKIITANDLSVAKKGYVDYGKPKDYEIIDLILKTKKKH